MIAKNKIDKPANKNNKNKPRVVMGERGEMEQSFCRGNEKSLSKENDDGR